MASFILWHHLPIDCVVRLTAWGMFYGFLKCCLPFLIAFVMDYNEFYFMYFNFFFYNKVVLLFATLP